MVYTPVLPVGFFFIFNGFKTWHPANISNNWVHSYRVNITASAAAYPNMYIIKKKLNRSIHYYMEDVYGSVCIRSRRICLFVWLLHTILQYKLRQWLVKKGKSPSAHILFFVWGVKHTEVVCLLSYLKIG
jgi:hypothetical protein